MPDMILEQAAVSDARTAYEELGMDVDKIQYQYLFNTGGKMIALAFLGPQPVFLSVIWLQELGREWDVICVEKYFFVKWSGFPNNEFDHFSTASLITRGTNDIQQVQFLAVMILRMVLYAPILALGGVYKVFQTNVSMSCRSLHLQLF